MTLFDLILIAVSLSMDAFAVSICKGLSVRRVSLTHDLTCGLWFGGFQALMPALGYFLGDRFSALLTKFGPWIAFVLLALTVPILILNRSYFTVGFSRLFKGAPNMDSLVALGAAAGLLAMEVKTRHDLH